MLRTIEFNTQFCIGTVKINDELREAGYTDASVIGEISARSAGATEAVLIS